jgi:predicted phosphodiesterase
MKWTVEHTHRNIVTIRMAMLSRSAEQWALLRSDAHHDNAKCDQALERKHLEQAKERGAWILDAGDLFCAMQGKYDLRSDRSALRPEYQYGPYLDKLVSEANKFYAPYAHNFAVIGRGNHEGSIANRHETDLTERLVALLNNTHGVNVQAGGYGGFVRIIATRGKQTAANRSDSKILHYFHGTGGGGPVTADMIQLDRMRNRVDADIYVFGHTHDSWYRRMMVATITNKGKPRQREILGIKCPSYKDAYDDGAAGWEISKGHPPKPLGAWWLRFYWNDDILSVDVQEAR